VTVGQGDDVRVEIQDSMRLASNYNRWIADLIAGHVGRRVIDAGCGSGNLAELLLDREKVIGVEVWDEFIDVLRERFAGNPAFEVLHYDLEDPALVDALREQRPDSGYSANVLEHVEHDGQALANLAAALPPGAPFFLLVPAFPVLYGEHDRLDHHHRRYTKQSLQRLLTEVPFEAEDMRYMNLPGFFAWFLLGRVVRKPLDDGKVGLYDRIIPTLRRVEARVAPPFGQTLVARLRRVR
jgi:SAM-dependent methyltransferase